MVTDEAAACASTTRDVTRLEIPRVGMVHDGPNASLPYLVLDAHGQDLLEVSDFLRHLVASDFSPSSVRSYALALLRWYRFLWAVDVAWDCRAGGGARLRAVAALGA
jgi:hypothetical protein